MTDSMLAGRTCLVTGANAGMGRVIALELARGGAQVVLLCRSKERGEQARTEIATATGNSNVDLLVADLASLAQVRAAAAEFKSKHSRLHVLVNNAAVFRPRREVTDEGFEKTFVTNYLSHFLLTHLLLNELKASAPARIVNVAARSGMVKLDFDDLTLANGYSVMKAVGPTKLALVMHAKALSEKLRGTGVTANSLHPGFVKTTLLKDMPWLMRTIFNLMSTTPEKGARTAIYLATAPDVEKVSGEFFVDCKPVATSGQASDAAAIQRLWDLSTKLTGLGATA